VNSRLAQLQPYPFEKLRALLAGLTPSGKPIPLSIGEPQHATPDLIRHAITDHLDGLSVRRRRVRIGCVKRSRRGSCGAIV
jgi:N-succinyldiaminopimelate aminotransferase